MATVVECDLKAPFFIPTHFPGFFHLPCSVPYNAEYYFFLSLWYDSSWDWILVSRAIGEHSTHYANGSLIFIEYSYLIKYESFFCTQLNGFKYCYVNHIIRLYIICTYSLAHRCTVMIFVRIYLPNPSARAGYDTRSIFLAELSRFEFRVFLLLE